MKNLGTKLKAARENKGLSLHEVGMSLKINPKTLQAIEEGETAKLPARTFLRGFIRSYATYLKLDSAEFTADFAQAFGEPTPVTLSLVQKVESNNEAPKTTPEPVVEKPRPAPVEAAPTEPTPTPAVTASAPVPTRASNRSSEKTTLKELSESSSFKPWTAVVGMCLLIMVVFVYRMVDKYSKESAPKEMAREQIENIEEKIHEASAETTSPSAEPQPEATPTAQSAETPVPDVPATSSTPSPPPAPTTSQAAEHKEKSPPEKKEESHAQMILRDEPPKAELLSSLLTPTTQNSTPLLKNTQAPTQTNHNAEKPVVEKPVEKVVEKVPEKPVEKVAEKEPVIPPAPTLPAVTNTTSNEKRTEKPTELILEAKRAVQVQYKFGEEAPQSLSLLENQVHTFKSRKIIQLELSDAGAVSVIVNGIDRGSPGESGKTVKISYPR